MTDKPMSAEELAKAIRVLNPALVAAIRADERERCAVVCENLREDYIANSGDPEFGTCSRLIPNAARFAAAIRQPPSAGTEGE